MPKKSLRRRLQSFVQDRWSDATLFFRFHWPAILIISVLALVGAYWVARLSPRTDVGAAQWALSTEVQSLAALLGIMLVGITVLWSQAAGEETKLASLVPKYYELLKNGGDPVYVGPPVIEVLRKEYLEKIRTRKLPRTVFPYKHDKYRSHRDLFVDMCRLSELVHEYFGLQDISDNVESDLKSLRFSEEEITEKILVEWYSLKSDAAGLVELITDFLHPGCTTIYNELEQGDKFIDKIWDLTLTERAETSVSRVKTFKMFRGIWFRIGFGTYVVAIAIGLAALSGTTVNSPWKPMFVVSIALGFLAIAFTVVFVHKLLRSE
jgi:hypothetical protein